MFATLSHGPSVYSSLYSVLVYPDTFVVDEQAVDASGVVTQGPCAVSGRILGTSTIVLSWKDVQASSTSKEPYNVVLHEFARARALA